jgi:hypothetical protein
MESSDARRDDAIRAGKKRSITDRLGHRRQDRQAEAGLLEVDEDHNQLDNMSIPQAGVSRNIPGQIFDSMEHKFHFSSNFLRGKNLIQ